MPMGSLCLAEAPSSSWCHGHEHGTGGDWVGEKAAKWHNCVVDTRESTGESSGMMSQTGGKLPLPDLPQHAPKYLLPDGVSLLVASPLANANADPGFPPGDCS